MRKMKFVLVLSLLALGACESKTTEDVPKDNPATEVAPTEKPSEPEPEPEPEVVEATVIGSEMAALSSDDVAAIVKSKDAAKLRDVLVWRGISQSSQDKSGEPNEKLFALAKAEGKPFEFTHPLRIGFGRTHGIAVRLGELAVDSPAKGPCGSECQAKRVNALLNPITQKDLLTADGVADAEALQKILDALAIEPTDKILGVDAAALYPVIKPSVEANARIYAVMKSLGKEKVVAEFEAAKKANPEPASGKNQGMLKFYRSFDGDHDITGTANVRISQSHINVGFWVRRMADGTDTLLEKFLMAHLQKFDSKLYDELYVPKK